jgi:outer membrane protein
MKKIILAAALCAITISAAVCQQIPKFGVVDTARVYTAYYRDTGPVKNYEAKKAEFRKEIDRLTDELRNLKLQKDAYVQSGDTAQALKIDAEITKRTEYITQYTNAKNLELKTMESNLKTNDDFYAKLYATLSRIAEREGYSMILSLQQANGILWHSPTVDITDAVITALGLR